MKKYFKRLCSVLVAVAMMLSFIPAEFAFAAGKATFDVDDMVGDSAVTAGSTVDIPVRILNNTGFGSTTLSFTLPTDWVLNDIKTNVKAIGRSILYYWDDENETWASNYNPTKNKENKTFTIAAQVLEDMADSGILCYLNVTVPAASAIFDGEYEIGISADGVYKAADAYTDVMADFDFEVGVIEITGGQDPSDYTPVFKTPAQTNYTFTWAEEAPELSVAIDEEAFTVGTMKYQWYSCTNADGDGAEIYGGATTTALTPYIEAGEYGTYYYYCEAVNSFGGHKFATKSPVFAVNYTKAPLAVSNIKAIITPDGGEPQEFVTEVDYNGGEYTFSAMLASSACTVSGTASATNAGTYSVTVAAPESANYTGSVNMTWTIRPVEIEFGSVSIASLYPVYMVPGAKTEIPVPTVGMKGSDEATFTWTKGTGVDVIEEGGKYYLVATEAAVEGSAPVVELVISGGSNYTNTGSYTYNVKLQTKNDVTSDMTFEAKADLNPTYSADSDWTAADFLNNATYKGSSTGITYDVTYTDKAGNSTLIADDVTDLSLVDVKNAGSYVVAATYEDATNVGTVSQTIEVAQATIDVSGWTWNYSDPLTYNTADQTIKLVDTNTDIDLVDVSYTNATKQDAGTYPAKASLAVKAEYANNYALSAAELTKEWTIEKAEITDEMVDVTADLTYNGSEQSAVVTVDGLTAGTDYTVSGNTGTNAASYELTVSGTGNYKGTVTKPWSIAQQNVTETKNFEINVVKGIGTFTDPRFGDVTGTLVYTGTDHTAIEGVLIGMETDATKEVSYTFTANGNYKGTISGTIKFTIVDVEFTVPEDAIEVEDETIYYGTVWSDIVKVVGEITASVNGEDCKDAEFTVKNADTVPGAGEQTWEVLFNGTIGGKTYEDVVVASGKVKIEKKDITASAGTAKTTKEYDGNTTVSAVTGEVALNGVLDSDKASITVTSTPGAYADKNVGKSEVALTLELSGEAAKNYNLTTTTVNIPAEITEKEITVTFARKDSTAYTFDNTEKKPEVTVTFDGVVSGDEVKYEVSYSNNVNAGENTAKISLKDTDGNYKFSADDLTFSIAKSSDYTVTPDALTVTYTPDAISASLITYTASIGDASVKGTWAWKDAAAVTGLNASETPYEVTAVFTPTGAMAKNLNPIDVTVSITVNKADLDVLANLPEVKSDDTLDEIGEAMADGKGTITWYDDKGKELDGDTKVEANTEYTFKFTPSEEYATNYNVVEGEVVPYPVNTYIPPVGNPIVPSKSNPAEGVVSASPSYAAPGTMVTITVTPAAGYEVDKLTLTDNLGYPVAATPVGANRYTFAMPNCAVYVNATFKKVGTPTTQMWFVDVKAGDWYYDAVAYAYGNGLMNGTTATTFEPGAKLTRGMLMTVLARIDGVDTNGGATWYTKGMEWAKAEGISDGTNPTKNITRQEAATMLYRYAGYPVVGESVLGQFPDGSLVAAWAEDAMTWAVNVGLLKGDNVGNLNPNGTATRAEIATMLMRFLENVQ